MRRYRTFRAVPRVLRDPSGLRGSPGAETVPFHGGDERGAPILLIPGPLGTALFRSGRPRIADIPVEHVYVVRSLLVLVSISDSLAQSRRERI